MILKFIKNIFGKNITDSIDSKTSLQQNENSCKDSNNRLNRDIEQEDESPSETQPKEEQQIDVNSLSREEQFYYLRSKAEQGEVLCMTDLAWFYLEGIGTEQDIEKGIYWTNKAADANDRMALHNLGCLYKDGNYVVQDLDKAVSYFKKASALKFGRSTNMLGVLAERGIGMSQNYESARKFYEQAIDEEEWIAYENLAFFYLNGTGVDKDIFKAAELFEKAAEKNVMTQNGNQAFNWLLLNMYCDGVDYYKRGLVNEARKYIGISSIYNFTTSTKFLLSNLYDGHLLTMLEEHNITRPFYFPQLDYIEKTKLYIRAANTQTRLRETEKGVARDEADELCFAALYILFGVEDFGGWNHIDLLQRSIENGFVTAYFWLGYCYEKGLGVEQSDSIAESCYQKVIQHGHPESLWLKDAFKSDTDRELAESHYRIAMIRYNKGKYKTDEICSILSCKYGECEFHSQSLVLISKCLIDEGKTFADKEVMELVSICAKSKNDEALYMLARYYQSIGNEEYAIRYCIEALQLGNIDAVKMYRELK